MSPKDQSSPFAFPGSCDNDRFFIVMQGGEPENETNQESRTMAMGVIHTYYDTGNNGQ